MKVWWMAIEATHSSNIQKAAKPLAQLCILRISEAGSMMGVRFCSACASASTCDCVMTACKMLGDTLRVALLYRALYVELIYTPFLQR